MLPFFRVFIAQIVMGYDVLVGGLSAVRRRRVEFLNPMILPVSRRSLFRSMERGDVQSPADGVCSCHGIAQLGRLRSDGLDCTTRPWSARRLPLIHRSYLRRRPPSTGAREGGWAILRQPGRCRERPEARVPAPRPAPPGGSWGRGSPGGPSRGSAPRSSP